MKQEVSSFTPQDLAYYRAAVVADEKSVMRLVNASTSTGDKDDSGCAALDMHCPKLLLKLCDDDHNTKVRLLAEPKSSLPAIRAAKEKLKALHKEAYPDGPPFKNNRQGGRRKITAWAAEDFRPATKTEFENRAPGLLPVESQAALRCLIEEFSHPDSSEWPNYSQQTSIDYEDAYYEGEAPVGYGTGYESLRHGAGTLYLQGVELALIVGSFQAVGWGRRWPREGDRCMASGTVREGVCWSADLSKAWEYGPQRSGSDMSPVYSEVKGKGAELTLEEAKRRASCILCPRDVPQLADHVWFKPMTLDQAKAAATQRRQEEEARRRQRQEEEAAAQRQKEEARRRQRQKEEAWQQEIAELKQENEKLKQENEKLSDDESESSDGESSDGESSDGEDDEKLSDDESESSGGSNEEQASGEEEGESSDFFSEWQHSAAAHPRSVH